MISADLIESFAGMYISPRYDDAKPTPEFHREAWTAYSADEPNVVCIAPRDHAKTTALSVDYILAEVLFRRSSYVILIGSTEEKAQEIFNNIADELHNNEELRRDFFISALESDTKTEVVVRHSDGHRFRILVRGAEQRIRGAMWNGKRPDLLVCDDMEDDEQVENKERRGKFRRWFFRAAKQALSRHGRIRVHGTILHEDSLLARLHKNKTWKSLFYKAHKSFDDFSDILWAERWDADSLRARREEFIQDQDSGGYSQEFLNSPMDNANAYLRKDDFLPMSEKDYESAKTIGVAADFAISTRDSANRTSFTVGGKCTENLLHIVDERVGRWDSLQIVDEIFSIQQRWNPAFFWVESGQIWASLSPMVYKEMQYRDIWINIITRAPIGDKGSRGRTLQRRHRAGGCRFDKEATWYADYEYELLRFTGESGREATLDDQFDSSALLALGFEETKFVEDEDFISEDEWAMRRHGPKGNSGRSAVTGY